MLLTRSQVRFIIICCVAAPLVLLVAFPSHKNQSTAAGTGHSAWSWLLPSGSNVLSSSSSKGNNAAPHFSKVLAHAPGFTLVENLYWRNHTYYLLTDEPWHVPQVKYIVSKEHIKEYGEERYRGMVPDELLKILSVRGPALNSHVDESRELGVSTLPEAAKAFSDEAIEIPGVQFFLNDFEFIGHYYHFIGEMFLGVWRLVSNYYYSNGKRVPNFTHVNFLRSFGSEDPSPSDVQLDAQTMWEDHAGANHFFIHAFFPGVKVQTRPHWEEMADTGKLYRFPLATIGDRYAGHSGPSASWKPWGDVLRLPVFPNWLTELRDRVVKIKRFQKPHVLYLTRQDTTRRLTDADHQALVLQLKKLEEDGVVKLTIKQFTDGDSFVDQVSLVGTVDFFVAVHGNGLTHTLWMNSGMHRGVFEIQPKGCSITDYSPLATAAGVQHYLVNEDSFCTPDKCPQRGCKDGARINAPDLKVQPRVITDQIRKLVAEHKYN